MTIYIVTAPPGGGKSLFAADVVIKGLQKRKAIAVNYDIYLDQYTDRYDDNPLIYRLPARPTKTDLDAIGNANVTYDEDNNGVLILDECGSWLNAQTWNEKGRQDVNDWFRHSRKLGWDVYLIVQHIDILDKQARQSLGEHLVICKRMDRMAIPFISALFRLFGVRVRMPRIHVASIRYGNHEQAPVVDRKLYRGGPDVFKIYDTKASFFDDGRGTACLLPTWLLSGRYKPPLTGFHLMFNRLFRLLRRASPLPASVPPARRVGRTPAGPRRLLPQPVGSRVKIEPFHSCWIYRPHVARTAAV
jgi:hypothetical protein